MTRQSSAPLEHRSLGATNREAVGMADLVEQGEMVLDAPYQRGSVWTLDQRIALIKSWLLGLPIPAIIINDRLAATWSKGGSPSSVESAYAVIDGKQRMETAVAWFGSEFAVPASWFPADQVEVVEDADDGPYVRFNGLTVVGRRRFSRKALIPVCEARVGTLREEAEIYLLVNGSGTRQTDDDMANAARVADGE